MKDLFIVKHDTYGSGLTLATADLDNLSDLAAGAFVMINMDPTSANYCNAVQLADDADHTALPAKFQIWIKTASGLRKSAIIDKTLASCGKVAYAAPVKKISTVGNTTDGGTTYSYNLPTLAEGQVAGITIIDSSKQAGVFAAQRDYTYVLTAADAASAATAKASITAALVAKINADTLRCVDAAVAYTNATDGVKLTAKTAGINFEIAPIGILKSTSIVAGTAHKTGDGTVAQVQALELEASAEYGNANYNEFNNLLWKVTSDVDTTKTYDIFKIGYNDVSESKTIIEAEPKNVLFIAVDAGLTAASFDSGLDPATAAVGKSRTALAVIDGLL